MVKSNYSKSIDKIKSLGHKLKLSKQCKERDNYICEKCKMTFFIYHRITEDNPFIDFIIKSNGFMIEDSYIPNEFYCELLRALL